MTKDYVRPPADAAPPQPASPESEITESIVNAKSQRIEGQTEVVTSDVQSLDDLDDVLISSEEGQRPGLSHAPRARQGIDEAPYIKLALVGGRGVGKSYLFRSMVYRALAGPHAGILAGVVKRDAVKVYRTGISQDGDRLLNHQEVIKHYAAWIRLSATTMHVRNSYRVQLPYRCGYFGLRRAIVEMELVDTPGEYLSSDMRAFDMRAHSMFDEASVMVFCLPLWVAFPSPRLSAEDWKWRDGMLADFDQVVRNCEDARRRQLSNRPMVILALTMADDRRSSLPALRENWIDRYRANPRRYLATMRTESGASRYLESTKKVSTMLYDEFSRHRDVAVASLLNRLDFGRGRPWLIPVSAIDGQILERLEAQGTGRDLRLRIGPPVPVHVELPLIVALTELSAAWL